MKDIKKKTKVASIFPNKDSINRLVSASLMKIDDDWATGKRYLNIKAD